MTFSFSRTSTIEQQREGMLGTSYHNLGQLYRQLGNRDAAIRALERALSYGSVMQVWTVRSLAELRIERREYAKAEPLLQRALALEPRVEERDALVRLYENMVADERYRSDPAVWRKLEGMYRAAGRGADADRAAARARP
jgi:tetratricopeptide (TPR) repeat protein